MKKIRICLFFLSFLVARYEGTAQTKRQLSGTIVLSGVTILGDTTYSIKGVFMDAGNLYFASDVREGDRIIDDRGNTFEIISITSNFNPLTALVKSFNKGEIPAFGMGTLFRPSANGLPLVSNSSPAGLLVNTINTTTLTIDAILPRYSSGTNLPTVTSSVSDVVVLSTDSKPYKLTASGWFQISDSEVTDQYVFDPLAVSIGPKGSMIRMVFDNNRLYVSNGIEWKEPILVSNLPSMPKYGDIFFVTGESKLYMFDANNKWVSLGGATPGSSLPSAGSAKPGDIFYNTGDNRLYVYNASQWLPLDNSLPEGKIYVGDANGIAVASEKNTIALSDLGAASAAVSLGNNALTHVSDPTAAQDAATKNYVDTKTVVAGSIELAAGSILVGDADNKAQAVAKSSVSISELGAPTAALAMAGNAITGIADPTAAQDAATKNYVDTKTIDPANIDMSTGDILISNGSGKAIAVPKNTVPVSGFAPAAADISMGDGTTNNKISNLADPLTDQDAATKKYVDARVADLASISLADGSILIGDASNQAVAKPLTGAVTIDNTGLASLTDNAVTTSKILAASVTVDKLASAGTADANKVYVTDSQGVPALVDQSTLSGTGSADKFADDFVVTGVANYLKWTNGQTVPAKGKTAVELLLEGSQMAVPPAYSAPVAGISGSPTAGSFEFGTNIGTITLSSTFTQNDAGALTGTTYSKGGVPLGGNTDMISSLTAAVTYTVTKTYAEGAVKNNNLGTPDPAGRIPAGSVTKTITYTPVASRYYGFVSSTNPTDAEVQALTKDQTGSKVLKTTLTNPSSAKYLCFRYPAAQGAPTKILINGFSAIGAFTISQSSFTNAQGYQSSYYLVIGNNPVDNSGASTTDLDFQ